jgi:hypothetical protein
MKELYLGFHIWRHPLGYYAKEDKTGIQIGPFLTIDAAKRAVDANRVMHAESMSYARSKYAAH